MIKKFINEYQMYKNDKKLETLEVDKGLILPRKFSGGNPNWGLGGVCDKDNTFVKASEYHGGWAEQGGTYQWEDEEYKNEEVVYFGLFFNHWGHFLVDLIGRLWYFVQNDKKIKLAYIGEEEPEKNFLEFFELLGIDSERLIHITVPTRFCKVYIPDFACRPCIWYTKEFLSIFDKIVEKVMEEEYQSEYLDKYDKVYFTRLNLKKAKNSEIGEQLIVEWVKSNGYKLFSPESLSLREQIYIWNHAKKIICLNGTIPINVVFCKNSNLQLIVLNKTSLIHKNLDLFLLMRKCNVRLLDAYYEPFRKYPKSIGEGPFLFHIGNDIQNFSKEYCMYIPFSKSYLRKRFIINNICLIWDIWDLKGKVRSLVSNLCPVFIKEKIRRIRKDDENKCNCTSL